MLLVGLSTPDADRSIDDVSVVETRILLPWPVGEKRSLLSSTMKWR
jgi:hypothetical protein